MKIVKGLNKKFAEIIQKHLNPIWTIDEMKWLVFDKYRYEFDQLSEQEQQDVLDWFDALHKLHGGN